MKNLIIFILVFSTSCYTLKNKGSYRYASYQIKSSWNQKFKAVVNFGQDQFVFHGKYLNKSGEIIINNISEEINIEKLHYSCSNLSSHETVFVKIITIPKYDPPYGTSIFKGNGIFFKTDDNFIILPRTQIKDSLQVVSAFFLNAPVISNDNSIQVLSKPFYVGKADTIYVTITNYKEALASKFLTSLALKNWFK